MKISVLYGGRLFFSLGNLFFPIYYYIFVIVNYGKDIRLRRIGLGNSSNLMKYRDKLFSPMAGHAFMVCLARWITRRRSTQNLSFGVSSHHTAQSLFYLFIKCRQMSAFFIYDSGPYGIFSPIRPLYQTKILTSLFLATPLSCNMMFLLFRKRCISNIYPVIILV